MKRWAGHLQYDWWKYIAAVLIPLVLWCSVFSAAAKPNADERLNVLFLGEGLDTEGMRQSLVQVLKERTEQPLKSVQVSTGNFACNSFSDQMLASTYSYDIIIVSQSQMYSTIGQDYFRVLPENLQAQGFGQITLYEEKADEQVYPFGIVLYDGSADNVFGKYYTGTECCYAFFSPQTENIHPLNEKSKEGNDAALQALRYLLEML